MSEVKTCHYCGELFRTRIGGLTTYETVKDSSFGQAYPVCSVRCQKEHNNFIKSKKKSSDEEKYEAHDTAPNQELNRFRFKMVFWLAIIIGIIILIKFLVFGNFDDAINIDPFK
jgi:hypothetical protein